jgi:Predicted sugar phosphate isomerase involved in capsule formation
MAQQVDISIGEQFLICRETVLDETRRALQSIDVKEVEQFILALEQAQQIFAIGVGRVALSLASMVKRLNHLDLLDWMVGDLSEPAATKNDLLVVASGSGESVIPVAIVKVAKEKGLCIAHIGANRDSTIGRMANIFVRIPVKTKLNLPDEMKSEQIMSSLFEQTLLLFADTVASSYARHKGLDVGALWKNHANLE